MSLTDGLLFKALVSNDMPTLKQRIEGGIVGLLVGDALGVPYEFHRRDEIPALSEIEFRPPANFNRAHEGVAPATWSDDGTHALLLLASLLDRGHLDLEDLGKRFIDWYDTQTPQRAWLAELPVFVMELTRSQLAGEMILEEKTFTKMNSNVCLPGNLDQKSDE